LLLPNNETLVVVTAKFPPSLKDELINLSGGVLRPDKEAIERAYCPNVSASQVIENTTPTGEASGFLRALGGSVRSTTGRR